MAQTHFSLTHRFLHWTIALSILLALFTAFLHATWMDRQEVASIITSSLAEKNMALANDDAQSIAKKIGSPMFQWHFYAGYVLIALLVLRFIDLFANGIKFTSPFSREATLNQKFRGWLYILFYTAVTLILIAGLFLKFGPRGDDVRELRTVLRTIHIYCGCFVALFVATHLSGVFIGENTTDKGIVSKMINGGK
ncbi:MAG: cytochrome b/b6 domain-containing protein [Proteobacteria bacterium]|nr:cytochrome b/b6 domain-containing protein [Pseudomonadota bacterium]